MCIHTSSGSDCARHRSRLCRYPLNTDCMRVACLSLLMIICLRKKVLPRRVRMDIRRHILTVHGVCSRHCPGYGDVATGGFPAPLPVLHGCWGRTPYDRCARLRVFWRDRGTCARARQRCVCAWRAQCCTVQNTMAWSTSHVMKHIMQCSMLHVAMSPRTCHGSRVRCIARAPAPR